MIALTGRAFRFLSQEVRGLQAAAYVLAACALLSSLLALVRDRYLAYAFGASTSLDLYYASFRIPDLIFVGLGALVSVYILIPELARRTERAQKEYLETIVVGFSVLAIVLSGLAALFTPLLLATLFPQFIERGFGSELVLMTRILLLQPILLGLSNILAAVTQARQRYALYSISPLLYNLGIIFGVVVLYPIWGFAGLAWGVVCGALLHAGVQIPSVFGDGFFNRVPRLHDVRALAQTALISIPRALALTMNQLTFIGLIALAAALAPGSIAVFMFGFNLAAVPLSVIGASYSVAAFPTLAAAYTRGEHAEFVRQVATAARYVFFWSLPISALILVLRAHVVRTILGTGSFDWTDTRLTAAAFALISLSLAAQGVTLLLVRGYYAAGRTFVPLAVAVATSAGTIVLALLSLGLLENAAILTAIENFLRVRGLPGSDVLALAASYAAMAICGAVILAVHFEYTFGGLLKHIRRPLMESALAALAAGLGCYIFLSFASSFTTASTTLSIFMQGFAGGLFGLLMAALLYQVIGSREYAETYVSVKERLWRRQPKGEITLTTSAEQ